MPPDSAAPTGNLSSAGGRDRTPGVVPWQAFTQQVKEDAPEWRWPRSIETADRMLNRAQVWSLYSATVLPIEGYRFWIDPNGNDLARVDRLAEDLGLPVGPDVTSDSFEQVSQPMEFDFYSLLHDALFAPVYGHHYFEWTGENRDGVWRITEIAPLHPSTVTTIKTDRQGRLEWVSQSAAAAVTVDGVSAPPKIPAAALIPFVYWPDSQRRWTGRSMLRAIYQNYMVNDILARVDVTNHERAGGIPWMTTDETYAGASLDDLAQISQEIRITEEGGGASPPGVTPIMLRGGGTDIVGSMKYHDDLAARAWHSMVRQLGSTETGSRALGSTFVDLEAMARRSIASWVCRTMNQWVCARTFLWNYGVQTEQGLRLEKPPPVLRFTSPELEGSADNGDTDSGGSEPSPDPQVAAASRSRSRPGGGDARRDAGGVRPAAGRSGAGQAAEVLAATDPLSRAGLRSRPPGWETRRQITDTEIAAAVDFVNLEAIYDEADAALEKAFRDKWLPEMKDALRDSIEMTRTGTERVRITALDMARIETPVVGSTELAEELEQVAIRGAMQASEELVAQGAAVDLPSEATIRALVADHAKATAKLISNGVNIAMTRKAVQLSNAGLTPVQLADQVIEYVDGLENAWEKKQLRGAVAQATNAGRLNVMAQVQGAARFYISATLDGGACSPCIADDGREFATVEAMLQVMPSGGNASCEGGGNCRCVAIAVMADEAPLL